MENEVDNRNHRPSFTFKVDSELAKRLKTFTHYRVPLIRKQDLGQWLASAIEMEEYERAQIISDQLKIREKPYTNTFTLSFENGPDSI